MKFAHGKTCKCRLDRTLCTDIRFLWMARWIRAPVESTNWWLSPEGDHFVRVVNILNTFLTGDTRHETWDRRQETRDTRLETRDSRHEILYVRVSCLECQVTFERYCTICLHPPWRVAPWCYMSSMIRQVPPIPLEVPWDSWRGL